MKYEKIGQAIGKIVDEKNRAYGDSFHKCGDYLKILYPSGVKPEQYEDMLGLARDFDKSMRIATNKDALGENPWKDKAGYAIIASAKPKQTLFDKHKLTKKEIKVAALRSDENIKKQLEDIVNPEFVDG
jgi:hypothetical protein